MKYSIKMNLICVAPPLLSFIICFIIGFNRSKLQWLYPAFSNNWSWIRDIVLIALIILLLIVIISISKWKIRKKVYLWISNILIVFLYIAAAILSFVFSTPLYHISYTTDLDNYLICDDISIGKEASEYFPEKDDFEEYECNYSYCYKSYPVVDQDFEIRLRINYDNDYETIKESIIAECQDGAVSNKIIILSYKTYNDHYRKMIVLFDDNNEAVDYVYSDHISDK